MENGVVRAFREAACLGTMGSCLPVVRPTVLPDGLRQLRRRRCPPGSGCAVPQENTPENNLTPQQERVLPTCLPWVWTSVRIGEVDHGVVHVVLILMLSPLFVLNFFFVRVPLTGE